MGASQRQVSHRHILMAQLALAVRCAWGTDVEMSHIIQINMYKGFVFGLAMRNRLVTQGRHEMLLLDTSSVAVVISTALMDHLFGIGGSRVQDMSFTAVSNDQAV